jgi:hypothetical protein
MKAAREKDIYIYCILLLYRMLRLPAAGMPERIPWSIEGPMVIHHDAS